MTDAKDDHGIVVDSVADQVGLDDCEFAPLATGAATTIGHLRQAVYGRHQACSNPLSGQWIELADIGFDGVEVRQRFVGPNYLRHE